MRISKCIHISPNFGHNLVPRPSHFHSTSRACAGCIASHAGDAIHNYTSIWDPALVLCAAQHARKRSIWARDYFGHRLWSRYALCACMQMCMHADMHTNMYRLYTEVQVSMRFTLSRAAGPRWCKKCRDRTKVYNWLVPWCHGLRGPDNVSTA